MKNWVISKDKEIVYKVGEFLIQVTTIEYYLEQIYAEFLVNKSQKKKFSGMMLGDKIFELSKQIKIGEIQKNSSLEDYRKDSKSINIRTRLYLTKEFRNKIFHNALKYDPINKSVILESKEISNELDKHILHVGELLTDLYIMLISLRDPKMAAYKIVLSK